MSLLTEIEWGPVDAAIDDPKFNDKFILPKLIEPALSTEIPVVSGEKGSGKTALQRHLLLTDSTYTIKQLISFNKVQFSAVTKNLDHLASAADVEALILITHYWQYVVLVEAMKAWASAQEGKVLLTDGTIVLSFLRDHGLYEMSPLQTLLSLIGKCWGFMDSLTSPKTAAEAKYPSLPTGLTPQVVEQISNFPVFDPHFIKAQDAFLNVLGKQGHRILIALDEFDDIRAKGGKDKRDQIQLIFDGLAQASYNLFITPGLNSRISVKTFIPHDRFLALSIRDRDKLREAHWPIRWNSENLQLLLLARMRLHPKVAANRSFHAVWPDVIKDKVKNDVYGVQENSFDYLVRHTMYRPRQLQRHLKALQRQASILERDLEDDDIRDTVRKTCMELAEDFITEFQLDHPNLEAFLSKFKKQGNVMEYRAFFVSVKNALAEFKVEQDTTDKINNLYEIGLIGVVEKINDHKAASIAKERTISPLLLDGKRYSCDFYYQRPTERISSELSDESLICFHPLFLDYCDQTPHATILVA